MKKIYEYIDSPVLLKAFLHKKGHVNVGEYTHPFLVKNVGPLISPNLTLKTQKFLRESLVHTERQKKLKCKISRGAHH